MIYLDNAATTKISPIVVEAMIPYLYEEYGNAGSIYGLGRRASNAVTTARKQVADFIGAKPEQIIFTSGGTEANNLAILGCRHYLELNKKYHIVTSPTEHDSVLKPIKSLKDNDNLNIKYGFHTSFLDVDKYGHIEEQSLLNILQDNNDVGLVSAMYVNNELGVINNIPSIGCICKSGGILLHTDCVQAAGTLPLNVNELACDLMSISSHKIHGPKGVGALYVRNPDILSAIIYGGAHQELGIRGGTENVAGIVGFGMACEIASKETVNCSKITTNYKQEFYKILKNIMDDKGIGDSMSLNGLLPQCTGKILSLTFDGLDAETLVLMMDAKGVCISAGSACRSHESNPSHVLKAIGMNNDDARSTIRISFSEFNTIGEVELAAYILAECIISLRSMR